MSLDKIFTERVEQPIQEKVLRTAKREEVILNEWCSYFEKTKKDEWDFGDINEQDCFLKTQEFLQSFKITPEL
ncbi:hypothetical protein HY643_03960, partial [Candidatus Woesearchaeota archaeon]|nr:hypothetical protein [Candidatus Woesearchaeota archaeon]